MVSFDSIVERRRLNAVYTLQHGHWARYMRCPCGLRFARRIPRLCHRNHKFAVHACLLHADKNGKAYTVYELGFALKFLQAVKEASIAVFRAT